MSGIAGTTTTGSRSAACPPLIFYALPGDFVPDLF